MNSHTTSSQEGNIISDIFRFPWIPFMALGDSAYDIMGSQGTVLRLSGLVIVNSIAVLITLAMIIGGNPYIPLNKDLRYFPFLVAFVFLTFVSFLIHTTAQFLCFRAVSGKGNLTSHGYINALFSTNLVILSWLAIASVFITRIRGLDSFLLILGGLYLLYPSLVALKVVHKVSTGRFFVGLALSIIVGIPLYILYLYLFFIIREARPYVFYDWRSLAVFSGILLIIFFILTYMFWQQRFASHFPEGVPILEPLKAMLKARWVQLTLIIFLIPLITFLVLDFQYPSLKTRLAPYSITFLSTTPDLIYVYTKAEEYDGPFAIEVWDLSSKKRLNDASAPEGQILRPNENGQTLIVSDYRENYVFDPQEMKDVGLGGFLPTHSSYNPVRNEFYRISYHGSVRNLIISSGEEERAIDYEEIIGSRDQLYTVAVHPNGEFLFLTSDNRIYIVEVATLELVDTIWFGGKLRDVAVSPDGKILYVVDKLWHRIRIIPAPSL